MLLQLLLSASLLINTLDEPVSFTLRNESLSDIPLVIPGVMNPNLSPKSKSGVSLQVGQQIFFWPKGQGVGKKKALLLIVDESLRGQTVKVASLIRERKAVLDKEG